MTKLGADYGRMRTYNPATVVKKAPALDTADEETLLHATLFVTRPQYGYMHTYSTTFHYCHTYVCS